MFSKGLVLVTGANGFIAARTVEAFLNAGYSVRGTVRSAASARGLLAALPDAVEQGRLEIVEVRDITIASAFDDAVKGVTAIAHLATPVSLTFTDPDYVIGTAVKGSRSILESAAKEAGLKNFVFMSSIAAIRAVRGPRPEGYIYTEADWNDHSPDEVARLGSQSSGFDIYAASKTLAEKEFWNFKEEKQPSFTMTAIHPVFVAGPPLVLPSSPENLHETTAFIWKVFSGQEIPQHPGPVHVDVRDVARLTVFGVEHGEEANAQRYITFSGWGTSQAAADILRKAYPGRQDIIQKGEPHSDYLPDFKLPPQAPQIDASKAVEATGQGWISYEKMVLDTAKAFEAFL